MKQQQPSSTTTTTTTSNKPSSPSPTSLLLLPTSPLLFEPTSVLEYSSGSPVDAALLDLPSLPVFDWDPLFPSPSSLDPLPTLLRASLAFDSGDRSLALSLLTSHAVPSTPAGPALHRSASYFREALLALLRGDPAARDSTPLALVAKIAALRSLHDLSPVPRFTSFTAHQAILDSLADDPPFLPLHLVDFDLGLGGHWSSLLRDLSCRPARVRLTSVAPAGPSLESALAADNLRDFAAALGVRLSVEAVASAAEVRLSPGEAVAVVFTPAAAEGLARFVRGAGARVAVMVDVEPWWGWAGEGGMRGRVAAGVEWYAAAMEAVEAAAGAVGCGEEEVGRVERAVVAGKVASAVGRGGGCFGGRWWWAAMEAAGMRAAGMSDFTEAQARWLARGAAAEGYQVERRDGGLMLTWHGLDMAATYAWRRC